jgi:BlaI family penicillinase repressor
MVKNIQRLPASELQIMMILWEGHPQMTRSEISIELDKERHLAPTTINTLLLRLKNKNFISATLKNNTNYYTPLISKKEYQIHESHSVLEQVFDGSLVNFVTALYDNHKITAESKAELEAFLENLDLD